MTYQLYFDINPDVPGSEDAPWTVAEDGGVCDRFFSPAEALAAYPEAAVDPVSVGLDVIDSFLLAMNQAGLDTAVTADIVATVTDYLSNTWGD